MDNLFQSKWFVRIVSLIFAIMLYLFVTIETETTQNESSIVPGSQKESEIVENVPVDIRLDSENYVVTGAPETVTVSLEGMPSVLTPVVRQKNFTVYLDLLELNEGKHQVEVEIENIPRELNAYIDPKEVEVTLEERATTTQKIDVEFINEDQLPLGYELGIPELNIDEAKIVSSRAIIEQIALVKVYIDVANVKETIKNREVPVNVYDTQGNEVKVRVDPKAVLATVPVERPTKAVEVKVPVKGKLKTGYKLKAVKAETEKIDIYGKKADINKVNEITTKPVDIEGLDENKTLQVELEIPDNIASSKQKIEVVIEVEAEKVN